MFRTEALEKPLGLCAEKSIPCLTGDGQAGNSWCFSVSPEPLTSQHTLGAALHSPFLFKNDS